MCFEFDGSGEYRKEHLAEIVAALEDAGIESGENDK
jgi:hypothetical protein